MKDILQPLFNQFMPFAQKRMGFQKPPRVFLRDDPENAQNPLGKTAYYDPEKMSVTLYINGRHPKDVMRSLSHELVHHTQNCNGQFNDVGEMGEGYAQNDSHLREMERQAYEKGNLCFRDWEDSIKGTIYNESLQKGAKTEMSTKDWKNRELPTLLTEKWGFSFNLLTESQEEEAVEEGVFKGRTGDDEDLPNSVAAAKKKRRDDVYKDAIKGYYGEKDYRKHLEEEGDERFLPPECRRGGAEEGSQKCIDAAVMAQGLYAESEEIEEGASSSGRELTADREQNDDRRSSQKRARPMEEAEEKGKYDDGDGKDEKCDHVPCKDQDKKEKMDEAQIRQIIRKLVKEAMNKKEAK
jgi:hypothetical protein